jgi:two-component system CheB/CheR fusion protein
MRDVTEDVRLQAELKRRVEQLAEADRRKDEFLAMLGHELRNPLAPIASALELLKHEGSHPARLEQTRLIIERQAGVMTRIVDDLLDVSRMQSGNIELRREDVALATLLERSVEMTRPLIDEKRHTLEIDAPAARSLMLHVDPTRLVQALANLLTNAAKYTEAGGRITVCGRREGGDLVLSVRDNGVGLDARLRETVFDAFTQGKASREHSRGGLGIGLMLVRRIVQFHGGHVFARSEGPGHGSEFVIRMPLPLAASRVEAGRRMRRSLASRPHRILVVDDNVDAAETLAECLRMLDHEVITAHSATAAIERALMESPDLVILDIGLPEMDGYEVARRMRTVPQLRSTVLVALTGFAQQTDVVRARQCGFDHHLSKPLDLPKLTALLESAPKPRRRAPAYRAPRANVQ